MAVNDRASEAFRMERRMALANGSKEEATNRNSAQAEISENKQNNYYHANDVKNI